MCGVFGFIRRGKTGPDLDRLRRMALATEARGPDAFGLAWLEGGQISVYKAPGRARDHLRVLRLCEEAEAVIGHCRWATHGHASRNFNNHPHYAGRGYIVHNGVVANYLALAEQYGLRRQTDCDSEVLGLLIAKHAGSFERRVRLTVWAAQGGLVLLGLWAEPTTAIVVRRGRPLWIGTEAVSGNIYLASDGWQLPGRGREFPDDSICVYTTKRAKGSQV